MKRIHFLTTAIVLTSMGACSKNDKDRSSPPPKTSEDPAPVVTLGLNGGLAVGKVVWTLPTFLEGEFKNLEKPYAEASLELDIVQGNVRKSKALMASLTATWKVLRADFEH